MQPSLFNNNTNILPYQGHAFLFPGFFTKTESKHYLQALLKEIDWRQEPIKIFGKEIMQPRLTAWYGFSNKPYTYSGITMAPAAFTATLLAIKEKIEPLAKVEFTSALLNLYRDGKDSMGWHRDNEPELGINPIIGSVSFGATRTFKLRHYSDKKDTQTIPLTDGSFLLMNGETQHYWEHHIPKTSKPVGMRINITFRVIR